MDCNFCGAPPEIGAKMLKCLCYYCSKCYVHIKDCGFNTCLECNQPLKRGRVNNPSKRKKIY